MKAIEEYGRIKDNGREPLPWLPDPRPPFRIWVKPEELAPFFIVQHHPCSISLLLKIDEGFKADTFKKLGLEGSSKDWEALARGKITEWEEQNSGTELFHFDCDEAVFCIYSRYIDDLLMFAKTLRAACNNESVMLRYLCLSLFTPEHRATELDHSSELPEGYSVRFQGFCGKIGFFNLHMSENMLLDKDGRALFRWHNTDDDGEFAALIRHANGNLYLVFRSDLYGYNVLELESGREMRCIPPQSSPAQRENFQETFIWTDANYDPVSGLLAVSGCFWACPYSVAVLDFSEPLIEQSAERWLDLRSIIDPDYEIYDDIDFAGWENGVLCLKGEGEPENIRFTAEQLKEKMP